MFVDLPFETMLVAGGAFLLGWLLAAIGSGLKARRRATERDPRDIRIRGLEAELRVARTAAAAAKEKLEQAEHKLKETTIALERRDDVITEQQSKVERISADLKDSVLKTRELRAELTDRATENVHAEAKIREVETELSVAQASTDMIATGVLDYSLVPGKENPDTDGPASRSAAKISKAAN